MRVVAVCLLVFGLSTGCAEDDVGVGDLDTCQECDLEAPSDLVPLGICEIQNDRLICLDHGSDLNALWGMYVLLPDAGLLGGDVEVPMPFVWGKGYSVSLAELESEGWNPGESIRLIIDQSPSRLEVFFLDGKELGNVEDTRWGDDAWDDEALWVYAAPIVVQRLAAGGQVPVVADELARIEVAFEFEDPTHGFVDVDFETSLPGATAGAGAWLEGLNRELLVIKGKDAPATMTITQWEQEPLEDPDPTVEPVDVELRTGTLVINQRERIVYWK